MAESAPAGRRSSPVSPRHQANGVSNGVGGGVDSTSETTTISSSTATPNRLALPENDSIRGGGRRSPTTGHVRRRRPSEPRSLSSPREVEAAKPGYDRISTSEDDDEYWHAYFAVQSKNIAAHNGSSIAAAAAGVLRPGPPRRPSATPSPNRQPQQEQQRTSTISRKSTAEKERGLGDRRPSAPDFSTVIRNDDDDEVLPPTPKPAQRRRVRSKSSGAPLEPQHSPLPPRRQPSPTDSEDNRRNTTTASETSSTASRPQTEPTGRQPRKQAKQGSKHQDDKALLLKKWAQATPPPAKKEVLSIDPAEVLRGLIPEPEQEVVNERNLEAPLEQQEDGSSSKLARSRNSSLRSETSSSNKDKEVARKSSLRLRERPAAKKKQLEEGGKTDKQQHPPPEERVSWWSRLFGRREVKDAVDRNVMKKEKEQQQLVRKKTNWLAVLRGLRDLCAEWRSFKAAHPGELVRMRRMWSRCLASLLLVLFYCGLGGFLFRFIEGAFESFYKCGVKRVKRDFIDLLWTSSHNLREDEWKSRARRKLWEFEEQLHAAHEAGVTSYSGIKSWSFLNAVVYCLTVITTIGYGHISPSTNTGRAATIIYAIFGIPMFLILLADFGKLFTRGIKFVWSFVRRLYYTGSCRQVRRTQPVQEIMKGAQMVYDLATFRRPSMLPTAEDQVDPENAVPLRQQPDGQHSPGRRDHCDEPPATPAPSAFEVDDEFNLPISVAIFILLLYIFLGASIYYIWESWGFFESFYFVFISMSTIGFGDFVPQHPMYMMASIVYLVFGLALTSMCINVVQEKLSDSFRQASAKIGATIGLRIAEEEASTNADTSVAGADGDAEQAEHGHFLSPNDAREIR